MGGGGAGGQVSAWAEALELYHEMVRSPRQDRTEIRDGFVVVDHRVEELKFGCGRMERRLRDSRGEQHLCPQISTPCPGEHPLLLLGQAPA